jgi:hypothetical protein
MGIPRSREKSQKDAAHRHSRFQGKPGLNKPQISQIHIDPEDHYSHPNAVMSQDL